MTPAPGSSRPIVAVVAVHGVADQKPNESARAIAQLLLGLRRGLYTRFTSFRESGIALPNERVNVQVTSQGSSLDAGRFDVRAGFLRENEGGTVSEVDYEFMRDLLGEYRQLGEDGVYQTVRLEGTRLADDDALSEQEGQGLASVHIYEAYWADLSRVSDRLYRILGEFYQLVLHLPFLGLQSLDLRRAAPDRSDESWWSRHRAVFAGCVSILTLPIPILNILLLALGLSVLPGRLHWSRHAYVAVPAVALLVAILSGWYLLKHRVTRRPVAWIPAAVLTILAALGTAWLVGCFSPSGPIPLFRQLGFGLWLAIGGLLGLLFRAYDRHRPGALTVAVPLYVAITLVLGYFLLGEESSKVGLYQAMLRTLEVTFLLLSASWLALALLATWHLVGGWLARRSFRFGSPNARALFTSRLALSLSIGIFSLVTVLLWVALLATVGQMLVPKELPYDPLIFTAGDPATPGPRTVGNLLTDILNVNGPPVFLLGVVFLTLAGVVVIWALGPSVWAELRPVGASSGPAAEDRAEKHGRWLSSGFRFLRLAGELPGAGVLLGTAAALLTVGSRLMGNPIQWRGVLGLTPDSLLAGVGLVGAVTGTVASLLALGRFADSLALGFRPALDVLLDVDNYLREHPRQRTPRARIAERYTTLLRYLCRWKDPSPGGSKAPYCALIIVAHSQGTVITADLLRFLRRERAGNPRFEPDLNRLLSASPPEDRRLPVYLMTMGCPLTQLYHLRFPDLYRWVGSADGAADGGPDPLALGVTRWVNLYRSGDYVGRSLWTPDSAPELFVPSTRPRKIDEIRFEGCIGAGAHTHYWDDTAPSVASELDRLIEAAAATATAHR